MKYGGDPSLSRERQAGVKSSLQRALHQAQAGRTSDALLRCDIILSLDPLFEPAWWLQQRIRSGESIDEATVLARAGLDPRLERRGSKQEVRLTMTRASQEARLLASD